MNSGWYNVALYELGTRLNQVYFKLIEKAIGDMILDFFFFKNSLKRQITLTDMHKYINISKQKTDFRFWFYSIDLLIYVTVINMFDDN